MALGSLRILPGWFWDVPYVGDSFPGAVPRGQVEMGANCQLWAYEVLAHLGHTVTDLRSDDLWYDQTCTVRVDDPAPLDLVLFNHDHEPYGAHVGVWTGDAVAHLCKEVGTPVVWDLEQFHRRRRYRVLIGFKRPTGTATTANPATPS